ncbi:hypothetical protein PAXINDRAFT_14758 [Paxillus involutus ATCC 200175]|uniref:Uncharacterized protein n=1 Tax=Paxillus involutus ATCC 200175 TaxID=664439 RepID=A0A0C9STZ7_PAXIN|nr:hypothetical protein PAXINDRAFT_14758 [Paxillus involutus ATCC 200175]
MDLQHHQPTPPLTGRHHQRTFNTVNQLHRQRAVTINGPSTLSTNTTVDGPSPSTDLQHRHQLHRRRAVITTVTSTTVDGPSPSTDLQHRRCHHQRTTSTTVNGPSPSTYWNTNLRVDGRNWTEYREKLLCVAAQQNLDKLYDGTETLQGDAEDWQQRNAIAKALIVETIPDSIFL